MVGYEHEVPRAKLIADTSGGIGQKEYLRPKKPHGPGGEYAVRHLVALIVVYPALHTDHRYTVQLAEYKGALVPRHGTNGKIRYLAVAHRLPHIYVRGHCSKPRPQCQKQLRCKVSNPASDILGGILHLTRHIGMCLCHKKYPPFSFFQTALS